MLAEEGIATVAVPIAVNTDEDARRLKFPGSPTIRVAAKTSSQSRSARRSARTGASVVRCTLPPRGSKAPRPRRCSARCFAAPP